MRLHCRAHGRPFAWHLALILGVVSVACYVHAGSAARKTYRVTIDIYLPGGSPTAAELPSGALNVHAHENTTNAAPAPAKQSDTASIDDCIRNSDHCYPFDESEGSGPTAMIGSNVEGAKTGIPDGAPQVSRILLLLKPGLQHDFREYQKARLDLALSAELFRRFTYPHWHQPKYGSGVLQTVVVELPNAAAGTIPPNTKVVLALPSDAGRRDIPAAISSQWKRLALADKILDIAENNLLTTLPSPPP